MSITNSSDTFVGDGITEGANTIVGTLNSRPNQTFTIQLFSNPSGMDEGKTLIGQNSVTTDIGGDTSFGLRVSRSKAPPGRRSRRRRQTPRETPLSFRLQSRWDRAKESNSHRWDNRWDNWWGHNDNDSFVDFDDCFWVWWWREPVLVCEIDD